jgi:hypothetical protein
MASPESLLIELSGFDPLITELVGRIGPLLVGFDYLSRVNGWVVDLDDRTPAATFDDLSLSADQRAVNGLLVACDYAVRRGAETADDTSRIIRRESPIAIPDSPLLAGPIRQLANRLSIDSASPPAFARRLRGHELSGSVRSDPALSFEHRSMDNDIGNNTLSSLTVHNEGTADQVRIEGELNERWAVEIGLPASVSLELIDEVERESALMPSFLHGITSYPDDDGIVIGWREGNDPDPYHLGVVIQSWTKALFDIPTADVRIVFAPSTGESTVLTDMRARSQALRLYRDAK